MNWLKGPWLHFIVLGLALFIAQGMLFPTPKPTIGPLSEARVETLQQQWFSLSGVPPTEEQLAKMIWAELDRDMLFQRALSLELHLRDAVVYQRLLRNMQFLGLAEGKTDEESYQQALEMRLYLDDEVVKRRLIQVMEQLLLAANPPAVVTEDDIIASFDERREELRRPPRYSIEQLYFSRDREQNNEIAAVVERIKDEKLTPSQARQFSSPFLPGYSFAQQSPEQLARHFGTAFVMNFEAAQPRAQQWVGPLRSTYGLHYVWVEAIEAARDADLDEVRESLRRDLASQARAAALLQAVGQMREQYEVIL